MIRAATLAGLVLALALSASAQKDSAKAYKTPQEVFDAHQAAEEKDDHRTLLGCLTADAQKDTAVTLGASFAAGRSMLEESGEEQVKKALAAVKPIYDVLDKHGLTVKVTKGLESKDAKERAKARKAALGALKDPGKFLTELFAAASKAKMARYRGDAPKTKLTDVKVSGDKATGTLERTSVGRDSQQKVTKEAVKFVKKGDGWVIDQSLLVLEEME